MYIETKHDIGRYHSVIRHSKIVVTRMRTENMALISNRSRDLRSKVKRMKDRSTHRFQRLPPARGGTAQKKIIHLANWSQLIHPGPASSLTKVFFGVESVMRVNADSLLIRAAATSTSGTLNVLTTDLIMANNNNNK